MTILHSRLMVQYGFLSVAVKICWPRSLILKMFLALWWTDTFTISRIWSIFSSFPYKLEIVALCFFIDTHCISATVLRAILDYSGPCLHWPVPVAQLCMWILGRLFCIILCIHYTRRSPLLWAKAHLVEFPVCRRVPQNASESTGLQDTCILLPLAFTCHSEIG